MKNPSFNFHLGKWDYGIKTEMHLRIEPILSSNFSFAKHLEKQLGPTYSSAIT